MLLIYRKDIENWERLWYNFNIIPAAAKKETISEKKHAELFVFSKKGTKGERMVKMAAEYLASVHRAGSGKNSKEEESK